MAKKKTTEPRILPGDNEHTLSAAQPVFKKFGGEKIEDVCQYICDYVTKYPGVVVAVGCDSQQLRKSVCYAVAISMYDPAEKHGGHIIFMREFVKCGPKPKGGMGKDDGKRFERLYTEVQKVQEYCDMIHNALYSIGYKHPGKSEDEEVLFDKLVDAHIDLNPDPGNGRNKSNMVWATGKGMLEGMGYRTFTKPDAYCASYAADLVCK